MMFALCIATLISKFVLLVDLYLCLVCDERRLPSANYVIDSFCFHRTGRTFFFSCLISILMALLNPGIALKYICNVE